MSSKAEGYLDEYVHDWQEMSVATCGSGFLPQNVQPRRFLRTMFHALARQSMESDRYSMMSHISMAEAKIFLPRGKDKEIIRHSSIYRFYSDTGVPLELSIEQNTIGIVVIDVNSQFS